MSDKSSVKPVDYAQSGQVPVERMGRSEIMLSRVGLGTTAATGFWGAQDESDMAAALREAVDAGINWIDIQEGRPEELVGRAVRTLPKDRQPALFVKCLRRTDDPENPGGVVDLSPEGIRVQVDGSLQRLGVDRVDLLQFHWPDPGVPIEESWGAVDELIKEGKLGAGGLSNFPVDLLERAAKVRPIDVLQQPLSLLDRSMNGPWNTSGGPDVLPWAREHGTSVIIFAPMQHGLLTGAFTLERAKVDIFKAGEILRPMTYWFQEPEISRALALVDGLKPIAERHGTTIATIACAWVLAWPGVNGVICGARRAGQIAGFSDALTFELTEDDLDEIAGLIESTGVGNGTPGDGPSRPV